MAKKYELRVSIAVKCWYEPNWDGGNDLICDMGPERISKGNLNEILDKIDLTVRGFHENFRTDVEPVHTPYEIKIYSPLRRLIFEGRYISDRQSQEFNREEVLKKIKKLSKRKK